MRMGLGSDFPVADKLLREERILLSIKSLDLSCEAFQKPSNMKRTLEKHANALINIEEDYFKGKHYLEWGLVTVKRSDYDKKVLDIFLPDVILSEDIAEVLNEFKKTIEASDFEIWYSLLN